MDPSQSSYHPLGHFLSFSIVNNGNQAVKALRLFGPEVK